MEGKGCCKEKPAEGSCSTEKTGSCGDKAGACGDKTGGCGGKSKCCPGTILVGALVGGIVMFIYLLVSWKLLPWHRSGPLSFNGEQLMVPELVKYFLFCLFSAALLTKVLKKLAGGCCPVAGSLIIGLLVGVFGYLPNTIWFHLPLHNSLVGIADDIIAITLAGAVISKCVLKSAKAGCGCRVCNCTGPCNCPCCCKKPDPTVSP